MKLNTHIKGNTYITTRRLKTVKMKNIKLYHIYIYVFNIYLNKFYLSINLNKVGGWKYEDSNTNQTYLQIQYISQ